MVDAGPDPADEYYDDASDDFSTEEDVLGNEQQLPPDYIYSSDPTQASIGDFEFVREYRAPDVSVTSEYRTAEHEFVDGGVGSSSFAVQVLGGEPDTVTIDGIVRENQLPDCYTMGEQGNVYLNTHEWSGMVVVTNVDTSPMGGKDKKGYWLHEVTIECLEVRRDELTDDTGLDRIVADASGLPDQILNTADAAEDTVNDVEETIGDTVDDVL